MANLEYGCIHTTDTPFGREVTPDDIYMWHLGALPNSDGTFTFLSKRYTKDNLAKQWLTLPSGKKVNAAQTNGRGWSKVGYSDLINQKGETINLVPYNFDDQVQTWEVTNGATGYNGKSRHVVIAGGWSKDGDKTGHAKNGKPTDKIDVNYNEKQIQALIDWVEMQRELNPHLKFIGHNDIAQKTCPNFIVSEFLHDYGLDK